MIEYPKDWDLIWMAADSSGNLATFMTAGEAPVPSFLLENIGELEKLESEILKIPVKTTGEMMIDVKVSRVYINLASRGLFVYDWTRSSVVGPEGRGSYELAARPKLPASATDVRVYLGNVQRCPKFDQVNFGDVRFLRVQDFFECLGG